MNNYKSKKVQQNVFEQQKNCCRMVVVLISTFTTCTEGGSLNLDKITGKVENLKIKNNISYHI